MISGKTAVNGAPSLDDIRKDLKNVTSNTKGVLYWELSIDNPVELALYDYIGLPNDQTPAIMIMYDGEGSWVSGPKMLEWYWSKVSEMVSLWKSK